MDLIRTFLLFLSVTTTVFTSECQVSQWTSWSECFGNCETALVVRNRDVTVPPLPTVGHRVSFRPCPHLYEVKSCKPKSCGQEEMPTPGPFPMKGVKGADKKKENVGKKSRLDKERPVFRGSKTLAAEEKKNQTMTIQSKELELFTTSTARPKTTTKVTTTTTKATTAKLTTTEETTSMKEEEETTQTENVTQKNEPVEEQKSPGKEYFINSLTLDLPIKNRLTADAEKRLKSKLHIEKLKYRNFGDLLTSTTDPTVNEVLKQLETAAENNQPVDEKKIRMALKKNKKLVKVLVEAYRLRQQNGGTSPAVGTSSNNFKEETAVDNAPESSTDFSKSDVAFEAKNASDVTTVIPSTTSVPETTTTPKFWPKIGYVPNTRKHASEITSKLYMTGEIVQVLSEDPMRRSPVLNLECLENKRCCKITRETCANGAEPIKVKRYYRPRGSSECVAYEYPRCSQTEEMDEQPIQFIQNCQDLCFNTPEKRISPLYALSKEV